MSNKTVLLVEDSAGDEALTLFALRKANVQANIVVARGGVEALDYLFGIGKDDHGNVPDLVLLDLEMPKVDGKEVLRRMRQDERTRHTPVVVFTSSKEEQDVVDAFGIGCNSYICKPVEFSQFAEVIRLIGMYWLYWNVPARPPSGSKKADSVAA